MWIVRLTPAAFDTVAAQEGKTLQEVVTLTQIIRFDIDNLIDTLQEIRDEASRTTAELVLIHDQTSATTKAVTKAILKRVEETNTEGTAVNLYKVKAHVGVIGNEHADEAAKRACEEEEYVPNMDNADTVTLQALLHLGTKEEEKTLKAKGMQGAVTKQVREAKMETSQRVRAPQKTGSIACGMGDVGNRETSSLVVGWEGSNWEGVIFRIPCSRRCLVGDTDEYDMTWVTYDDGDVEQLYMNKERTPPSAKWPSDVTQLLCVAVSRSWLPATEAMMRLHLMCKGTIKAASLQPYLSAINNYHEDMGYDGPAKGHSVSRAVKGMASLQVEAAGTPDEEETVRTWLPARHVAKVPVYGLAMQPTGRAEVELLRACTYVVSAFVTFGHPDTGDSMQRFPIAVVPWE
ncbi:hypothetical protein CYMTET_55366 [Cymbomonas tetramitiformis]|uniref:RNase H type-1 domain-containing protein n=1 Tax=Cymbomonas tetramitiformis TaxID=36881 RepID=A0AAE0BEY0_9CHLO|nr:hypothetical protein CYMTET_55366 [Cymbomonas tetramitiformis]